MNKNKKLVEENVIVCKLMGMGHDHLCKDFSEKKCMLCQLRNRYNNTYAWIVNDIDIKYAKKDGVDGVFRVLTPKTGLSKKYKEYVNNKLVELYSIRELIDKYEKCN